MGEQMHLSAVDSDIANSPDAPSAGHRLAALLRERQPVPGPGDTDAMPPQAAAWRASYLTAAAIAAALVAAWAGLCII